MRNTLLSVTADILTGIVALVLFLAGDAVFHLAADMREGVVSLAVLSLGAGFLRGRGRPENAWLKGLLVSSGGSFAFLILLWGQIQHVFLAILLLAAILFAVCGARARQLWSAQAAAKGGMLLVVATTGLVVLAVTAIPAITTRVDTRKTMATAPIFSMSTVDGSVISSADFRGRVIVLDFWATWCPACRRELPEVEELYKHYRGNSKVGLWAVDSLENGETAEQAREFIRKAGYTLPVAFEHEKFSESLGVGGLPSLIVMDKSGRIRFVHAGYDRSERFQTELAKEIETLLGEHL